MRDLNLGPDTKRLIESYRNMRESPGVTLSDIALAATQMAQMLERWSTVCWCWHDNCPAQICSGPHFKVKYQHISEGRITEIIEPYNKIGETFPDVPYTVIR